MIKKARSSRPSTPDIVQLHNLKFDLYTGDGTWQYYHYPTLFETDIWLEFESYVNKNLRLSPLLTRDQRDSKIQTILEMMTNFKCVNVNLITGEISPVIPIPDDGLVIPIPSYDDDFMSLR